MQWETRWQSMQVTFLKIDKPTAISDDKCPEIPSEEREPINARHKVISRILISWATWDSKFQTIEDSCKYYRRSVWID